MKNVNDYLVNSHCFILSSFNEGLPNCLIESCSAGMPVVAINAPGGLNKIIDKGINRLVSDDKNKYIDKINEAM